jgi:DNA-binding NarL/FixJ family response regulator
MSGTGKPSPASRHRGPIEVMVICRAELLLLGLERLLAQSPDVKVFTYSALPTDPPGMQPALSGSRAHPDPESPNRIALLSDRQAHDVVADCERILAEFADEVVLLSSRPDMSLLLGCMAAGARSFVMEGDRPEILLSAIRSAARHRTYMGQRTLDLLVDWLAAQERARGAQARGSRDDDLLRLLAEGRSTADIAERLGIAPKTVRNRTSQLYRRLGVRSRNAAVRLAEQKGLLDQSDRGRS